jgi:putative oxidoreductase
MRLQTAIDRLEFRHRSAATMDTATGRAVDFVGRLLLALLFLFTGFGKLADWSGNLAYMQTAGLKGAAFFLAAAIVVELAGGLSIVTGTYARLGAIMLAIYLVPVTLVFHDFWTLSGAERQMQMVSFLKNLAVMGGLALVAVHGPGRVSVDERIAHTKPRG